MVEVEGLVGLRRRGGLGLAVLCCVAIRGVSIPCGGWVVYLRVGRWCGVGGIRAWCFLRWAVLGF
jgi:hypothetical protein